MAVRDQLREAIQRFSRNAQRRHVYAHTGWREIDSKWIYLTASGAIGADGFCDGFEVELGRELSRYSLPCAIEDPRGAMEFSLRLLEIAPFGITAPLWAGIFRAPLASVYPLDIAIWLEGFTGSLKSTLAALFLCHLGHFERTSLPGAWSSTANALEHRAFILKDAPFVVDDYAPATCDPSELQRKAARLIRSQGNLAGRGRLRADLSERPDCPPRGLIISTGEQHPAGQSLLARICIVQTKRKDIHLNLLSEMQTNSHRLPHAMAGYLQWLAPQIPNLPAILRTAFAKVRSTAMTDSHLRVPEALAHLWLGLDCGLRYGEEIGAISSEKAGELRVRAWSALLELSRAQTQAIETERPTRRFLEVLSALLTQRRATLLSREYTSEGLEGNVAFLGWYDDDFVYLNPDAAFAAVARFCRDQGEPFPVRHERLLRDFADERISECNPRRHTKMARVGGSSRRTLCLRRAAVRAVLGEELPLGDASDVSSVSGVSGFEG